MNPKHYYKEFALELEQWLLNQHVDEEDSCITIDISVNKMTFKAIFIVKHMFALRIIVTCL